MNFIDLIKKSVVSEFTGTISVDKILLSLLTAFLIGIFITYIYRKTYTGVVYSKSFSLCIILLAMVTALIIRTINSNLALSLGMVGALSIVRFRTAVKEPVDTGFMFWGIMAGIMAGAGLYLVAITGSLALGVLYFVSYLFGFKMKSQYLLIMKYDLSHQESIVNHLKTISRSKLKSKSIVGNMVELTMEIELDEKKKNTLEELSQLDGVVSSSVVSYQNDFGM